MMHYKKWDLLEMQTNRVFIEYYDFLTSESVGGGQLLGLYHFNGNAAAHKR